MILIGKILWPEMKTHWRRLVLVLITGILVSAFKAAIPELMGMVYKSWEQKDMNMAIRLPAAIAGCWLVSQFLRYFHMYWMLYISEIVAVNLRRQLMNKYLTLNLGFFQTFVRGSGGLISRMLND